MNELAKPFFDVVECSTPVCACGIVFNKLIETATQAVAAAGRCAVKFHSKDLSG
jgi:hypothetical protein